MVKIYGYSKCSTVKKSLNFLDNNNIHYVYEDNVANKLSKEELKDIYERSGLELKKFFNTSGIKYRELGLKDKLKDMTSDECLELLSTDGMLVKRPILITDKGIMTGFNEQKWLEIL